MDFDAVEDVYEFLGRLAVNSESDVKLELKLD